MPLAGSTVVRRQLGRHLRRLRDGAGKSEADVEEANLASRAKLWRIETGKVMVKVGDVRGLCWLYGVDPKTTDALAALAVGTHDQGWWEDYVGNSFGLYLGLEAAADEIRSYSPEFVHGLLQTPDYVRALRQANEPANGVQGRVTLPNRRQQTLLDRTPQQRLVAVLGAAALARPVGGPAVMAEQLGCLRDLNRRDNIDIRVLPWEAGPHPAMYAGPFAIFDFHHDDDPAVVHVETHTGACYLEKPDELAEYRRIFDLIYRRTTPIENY